MKNLKQLEKFVFYFINNDEIDFVSFKKGKETAETGLKILYLSRVFDDFFGFDLIKFIYSNKFKNEDFKKNLSENFTKNLNKIKKDNIRDFFFYVIKEIFDNEFNIIINEDDIKTTFKDLYFEVPIPKFTEEEGDTDEVEQFTLLFTEKTGINILYPEKIITINDLIDQAMMDVEF